MKDGAVGLPYAKFSYLLTFVSDLDPELTTNQIIVFLGDVQAVITDGVVQGDDLTELHIKTQEEADKMVEYSELEVKVSKDTKTLEGLEDARLTLI